MGRQEEVRALRLTIKGAEGYDDTKPRSQLAFGQLLGFAIGGGDPGDGARGNEGIGWAIH